MYIVLINSFFCGFQSNTHQPSNGPLKLNPEVHAFANYSRLPWGFDWDEPMNRAGFRHEKKVISMVDL